MFGTIRKHQTWLWAVIITLTIISFVVFFSPYSKLDPGAGGPGNLGSINGVKLTPEEFAKAEREVYLRYFFMTGQFPSEETRKSGFDPMRETYYRLLIIHKQKDLDVHVSSDLVAQTARRMLLPLQKSNINSPTVFLEQVLKPRGFSAEDFERFVRHELGIQEMVSTVALSGKLVTPQEAQGLYEREHEEVATEAAFFQASNYLASVTAPPESASFYYSNNIANYRVPERMQVSYVKFVLTNFLAEANAEMAKMTNIEERLELVYQRRGTNYYSDTKSPQEAKEKIREEMRRELTMMAAGKKATAFATELFDQTNARPENLALLAKEKGLTVEVTAPFDREEGPKDLRVNPDFAKKAFMLSPTDEPFAGPLPGEDAAYVIAFEKRIPSEIPPFEQLRDRVTADFKYDQAKFLARQAGENAYTAITNGLAQGKTFSNICAEIKAPVTVLPPFSISTRTLPDAEPYIALNQLKQQAFSTPPGKVSNFGPTPNGGTLLYVKAKIPVDPAKLKADLPEFVNYVRQTRQTEAFNEWFRRQAERGLRDTPLAQPKPAPAMNSGPSKS
jgi:peptidyl-prolyl cis-trans isomerase D